MVGISLLWESTGGVSKYLTSGGTLPPTPSRENLHRGVWNLKKNKRTWVVSKEIYIKKIKWKILFAQLHMLHHSLNVSIYILFMSCYNHFIHTIYLLKWFENNYFPMILWLEPNGVHCKLFYSEKLMKEFFQNREEAGWPINRLFWISEREGS